MSDLGHLIELLGSEQVSNVVPFNRKTDRIVEIDLSENNTALSEDVFSNTLLFSRWIDDHITRSNARYAVGGYGENRKIYSRSKHFCSGGSLENTAPGLDIWAPVATPIYAPLQGTIYSWQFNNHFGDYGATLILRHQLEDLSFYSLFGHLSLNSIRSISKGLLIESGTQIATLGDADENGNWPPHLHFQLIFDLGGMAGDYPGVCEWSQKDKYLSNCPNPLILLKNSF
jgi:peptidoglycan LD-endopeptidase LytH